MERDYNEFIKPYLNNLQPLEPITTDISPRLMKAEGIKAVIFDIYGTLIVSASGDIDRTEAKPKSLEKAFTETGIKFPEDKKGNTDYFAEIIKALVTEIKDFHALQKSKGIKHPEVNVLDCWTHALPKCDITADCETVKRMAIIFELFSNQVYPMPKMNEVLDTLKAHKYPLGIVSNAQFYTYKIMNHFRRSNHYIEGMIYGFEGALTSYSFKELHAKPGTYLYERLLPSLHNDYDVYPHEVLYVGNDMLNDIYPAHLVGFQTVLFAGDKRSLRMRTDKKEIEGLEPDYIITELNQILDILGINK